MGYKIITLAELTKMLEKYNHKELHVHHTWRPNHAQYYGTSHTSEDQRALDRQKAFYDYHTKTNGWIDIAQHVTLLPDGRFVTGRDFSVNPASIAGYNSGAFAVEMIGDFDIGRDKFEGTQKESMIGLARWFDKKGKYIRFHRENSSKTCPGSGIDKNEFMAEVRDTSEASEKIEDGGDKVKKGDKVKITGSKYTTGRSIPGWVKNQTHEVAQVKGDQVLLGYPNGISSWVYTKDVKNVSPAPVTKPTAPTTDYKKLYEAAKSKIDQIKKILEV